jgi:hypothetical protein
MLIDNLYKSKLMVWDSHFSYTITKSEDKETPWSVVRKRSTPTERPQLDEVSANFRG